MKILLINKFHYPKGGSETYYFALAEALAACGHEVIFFAMQDERNIPCNQASFFVPNVEYNKRQNVISQMKSGIKLIYSFGAKRNIIKLIEKEKPDVAHLNLVHRQITFSVVDALHKRHIPIVFTLHDLICVCPCFTMLSPQGICEKCLSGSIYNCVRERCIKNSKFKSLLAYAEARFLRLHRSYEKISLYITPSNFNRMKMLEGRFTSSPVVHKANFLPMSTAYELSQENDGYLLYFGRLSPEKGIMTLLRAIKLLPESTALHIAGDGPQREQLESFIWQNGLEKQVKLLGFLEKKDMERVVSKSKCVILPSECYENGPYSVMEAMAKGKPVVGARIGGIPELIEDGITGYTFEAFNAQSLKEVLGRMLELPDKDYKAMCYAALKRAEESFGWQPYVKWLNSQYSEMIKQFETKGKQAECLQEDYMAR